MIDGAVDVGDGAAAPADQVVVLVGARVVDGGAALRGDPADEAELLEQLQGRVDRRQRDARHPAGDVGVDLLGRRVAVEVISRCGVTRWPRARRASRRRSSWAIMGRL